MYFFRTFKNKRKSFQSLKKIIDHFSVKRVWIEKMYLCVFIEWNWLLMLQWGIALLSVALQSSLSISFFPFVFFFNSLSLSAKWSFDERRHAALVDQFLTAKERLEFGMLHHEQRCRTQHAVVKAEGRIFGGDVVLELRSETVSVLIHSTGGFQTLRICEETREVGGGMGVEKEGREG